MAKETAYRPQHHADRRRYEQIIERYLRDCYAGRTAARAAELAALLKMDPAALSRIIHQLFGKSLRHLLRERQLKESCRLLRVTNLPIEDIAVASAFGTDATLYRCFRAAFGMTPGEYREQAHDRDARRRS